LNKALKDYLPFDIPESQTPSVIKLDILPPIISDSRIRDNSKGSEVESPVNPDYEGQSKRRKQLGDRGE